MPTLIMGKGMLAGLLILVAAGAAFGQASKEGSHNELNVSGMSVIGDEEMGPFLARVGVGFQFKVVGLEIGIIAAPWYGMNGVIFDGALVVNPLFDKPVSPVLRFGGLTSTGGGFSLFAGGGIRVRLTPRVGIRLEYEKFIPFGLGLAVAGVYFSF